MKLWIDTEFNGFQGHLISMALVDENDQYFYEELNCPNPVPWVYEHVMSKLSQSPIDFTVFQKKLSLFLNKYENIEIIADWPEDIEHFCKALITGPGKSLKTPPANMRIISFSKNTSQVSKVPHHALHDAFAIKKMYLEDIRIIS